MLTSNDYNRGLALIGAEGNFDLEHNDSWLELMLDNGVRVKLQVTEELLDGEYMLSCAMRGIGYLGKAIDEDGLFTDDFGAVKSIADVSNPIL